MNKAFQTGRGMDGDTRSKAYYYRGMARIGLLKKGSNSPEIGPDPYLNVYNDLENAILLDNQWKEPAQAEMSLIYQELLKSARSTYNLGRDTNEETEVRRLFGSSILKLTTAAKINDNFQVNSLLGKAFYDLGFFYDQLADDDASAENKAVSSDESAKEYFEKAFRMNGNTLDVIRGLKDIA